MSEADQGRSRTDPDAGHPAGADETGPVQAAASQPRQSRSSARAVPWPIDRLGRVGSAVAAVVATLAAAVTVVAFLRPEPPEMHAAVRIENAQWPVTLREFEPTAVALLNEIGADLPVLDEGQRNAPGAVVAYSAEIAGYKGRDCTVNWSLRQQPGNRSLPSPAFAGNPAWPVGILRPESQRDMGRDLLWAPLPRNPGTYAITIVLACDGRDLTSATQDGITVR